MTVMHCYQYMCIGTSSLTDMYFAEVVLALTDTTLNTLPLTLQYKDHFTLVKCELVSKIISNLVNSHQISSKTHYVS